mmetsp:Transcript_60201/g.191227  ORF Transcript_60201/g.191227 Transcript_60201/m.191227 type:complete len:233 (+) Transcript_60201:2181-2879(+)
MRSPTRTLCTRSSSFSPWRISPAPSPLWWTGSSLGSARSSSPASSASSGRTSRWRSWLATSRSTRRTTTARPPSPPPSSVWRRISWGPTTSTFCSPRASSAPASRAARTRLPPVTSSRGWRRSLALYSRRLMTSSLSTSPKRGRASSPRGTFRSCPRCWSTAPRASAPAGPPSSPTTTPGTSSPISSASSRIRPPSPWPPGTRASQERSSWRRPLTRVRRTSSAASSPRSMT